MKDLISIIIPVYNVHEFLERCINSLINQTYKNIEIILIDDGSVDGSSEICDDFSKKDSRVKVIHKKNEGVSIARNVGLENALGRYITFVDSDDYVENTYIEVLYNLCSKDDVDISICGTINEASDGKVWGTTEKMNSMINGKDAIELMLNRMFFGWTCWTKMYKSVTIKKFKFRDDLKIAEDVDFLYKALKSAKKVNVNTYETLYHYAKRENSATSVKYNDSRKKEMELYKIIKEDMERLIPNASKKIDAWLFKRVLFDIRIILRTDKNKEDLKNLKKEIKNMKNFWFTNKYITLKQKFIYVLCLLNIKN